MDINEIAASLTEGTSTAVDQSCPYCGNIHKTKCPLVKRMDYHDNGMLKSVEFHSEKSMKEEKAIVVTTHDAAIPVGSTVTFHGNGGGSVGAGSFGNSVSNCTVTTSTGICTGSTMWMVLK